MAETKTKDAPPVVDKAVCGFEGCKHREPNPMLLGLHRKRAHGIAGKPKAKKTRPDRPPKEVGAARPPSLKKDLARVFKLVGTVVGVVDPYCGGILADRSGGLCEALARLADEDPRIGRWLRALGKGGPYGALVVAAGEVAIPIAAHHGRVPPAAAILVGAPLPPVAVEVPVSVVGNGEGGSGEG